MIDNDLRVAIIRELKLSIQEFNPDFMLIPHGKWLSIDNEHRIIDLLFYHRNIQCIMPIHLTFGELQKDDIEWMKANLQTLLKYKIRQGDNKPIGFILSVQDNKEHVKLITLEPNKGFISKNLIEYPLKQFFKAILHKTVLIARKQLTAGEVSGGNNKHRTH